MDSQRWRRRAAVLGISGALLAPLTTGMSSAATSADPAAGSRIVVTTTPEVPTAAGQEAGAAVACNRYDRTKLCWRSKLTITVLRRGVPTGRLYGTITQTITLGTKSRNFSERISIKTDRIVGNASGIRAGFSVSCGKGCKAHSSGVNGKSMRFRSIIRGKINYSDKVRRGHSHAARTSYILTPLKPGYVPGPAGWRSPIAFRCDDRLKGQRAGCVFPQFTPTITKMRQLRFIALNIRKWQSKGAPKVLHRNSFREKANRAAVCGRAHLPPHWTPPPGWPLPATGPNKPSCDEYAFARTNEGGRHPGNGYDWVPLRENNSQGGMLSGFFKQNRVLDATSIRGRGDAFRVAV
jgi:hypothetical protein